MSSIIIPRKWQTQPQYPVEVDHSNPLARNIRFALDPSTFSRDVSGRNTPITVVGSLTRTATQKGIGLSGFASGYLSFPEPITQASAATVFALLRNASTGDQGLWTVGQSSQQDHWPYAGVSYLSALAASRWVSGVSIPGSLLVPHSLCVTRDEGAGSVNFVAYKDGVSFATGTPFPNSTVTTWNIGRNSGTDLRYGGSVLAFFAFNRKLSASEVLELNKNPWQIFRKQPQVIYFDVGGATTTTVQCSPGSVVVTGQQATIIETAAATAVECSAATVPVTGAQATVIARTHIAASPAAVVVSGQQATVVARTHIAASPAAVVVSGQQASITQILAGAVECSPATVPVTGQPATIIEYSRVVCSPATVPVTGQQATLLQRTLIPSTAATVVVTGQQATVVGAALTAVECSAATVVVAGQQAGITETAIVTTRVECSPSTVAVIGGAGNVVSIGGLRSRRNRGRYITYTEPTAGEPLPKLPHAPRRKARLADVLEFIPTPEPARVEPTPIKVEAKPAVIAKPKAKLSPEMELLAEEVTRRVVAALMPILAPEIQDAEDEEEIIKLLLSRFAA